MTQKDKELLLKDLCARLPYGVKVNSTSIIDYSEEFIGEVAFCSIKREQLGLLTKYGELVVNLSCDIVKPYLRPMSSMNEKEKQEFSIFTGKTEVYVQQICLDADSMANPIIGGNKCVYWGLFDKCIDWLNEHYFDYRGLIGKGLAIEAPEGMYDN